MGLNFKVVQALSELQLGEKKDNQYIHLDRYFPVWSNKIH